MLQGWYALRMQEGRFICHLVKTGFRSATPDGSSSPVIMETSTDSFKSPLQKRLYLGRDYGQTDWRIFIIFAWQRAEIIPNVVLRAHHDPMNSAGVIGILRGPLILRKFFWYLKNSGGSP